MATLIPVEGSERPIARFPILSELHAAIDCTCICSGGQTADGRHIYVDDEGLLVGKGLNARATMLSRAGGAPDIVLVGNAVVYDLDETQWDRQECPGCHAYIEDPVCEHCGWRHPRKGQE